MDENEYNMSMDLLVSFSRQLLFIPLDDIKKVISKTEAAGPILAPSEWQQGGARNVQRSKRLVKAAIVFRDEVKDLIETAE